MKARCLPRLILKRKHCWAALVAFGVFPEQKQRALCHPSPEHQCLWALRNVEDNKTFKGTFKVQCVGVAQRALSKTNKYMAAKTFFLHHKLRGMLWARGEALWLPSWWGFSAAGDKCVISIVIWILFPQSIEKNVPSCISNLFQWTPPKPHQHKGINSSTSHLEALRITDWLCSMSKSSFSEH